MFDHECLCLTLEWLTEKQMRSLNFGYNHERNSRCQFTIHFPLYSQKIPTKLLCKDKCLKIWTQYTKPVSLETNFSAICCEQKFFCVGMIDAPLGVRCLRRMSFSELAEHGLSRGSIGEQSWLSVSYRAWVTGSSIVLLVKEADVVTGMTEALFQVLWDRLYFYYAEYIPFVHYSKFFMCFLSLCPMSLLSLFLTSANAILSFSNLKLIS